MRGVVCVGLLAFRREAGRVLARARWQDNLEDGCNEIRFEAEIEPSEDRADWCSLLSPWRDEVAVMGSLQGMRAVSGVAHTRRGWRRGLLAPGTAQERHLEVLPLLLVDGESA